MSKLFDINSGSNNRDWEYLPEFCLLSVLEKIDGPIGLVRFGAVTRHWHSMFNIFLDIKRQPSSVPMLLTPSKKSKVKLFSLEAESKVSEIEFPKPYTLRCCGSSYGWLVTVADDFIITLSNPFKNNISIDLPPLYVTNHVYYSRYDLQKVVLSDDPLLHPSSYAVIVIYGVYGRLAFYQSARDDWILIVMDDDFSFEEVIFHKNWVYGIGRWELKHHLVSFDINGVEDNGKPKMNILEAHVLGELDFCFSERAYLVKSSMGNFYSVHKLVLDDDHGTTVRYSKEFRVFKLVLDDENGDLLDTKEVENVDGDIVFVGNSSTSLAVSVFDFPQTQPNSIYFIHKGVIGIFHLKDKSFGKTYKIKSFHKYLDPFIWISPPVQLNSTLSD